MVWADTSLRGGSTNGDSLCPSKEARTKVDKVQVGTEEKQSNERVPFNYITKADNQILTSFICACIQMQEV